MSARSRRRLVTAIAATVAVGIYFAAIFPTGQLISTYLAVRADRTQLAKITAANRTYRRTIAQLNRPSVVGEIARNQYGMYPKGSVPYQVLPSSTLYSNGKTPPS